MDLLTILQSHLNTVFIYTIPFLFVLTIIIFVHELGHFLVARWCGVKVDAFSIGFGPEIFGFTDSKGTRWKFAWIPLGGYVKFFDDENVASTPPSETSERGEPEKTADAEGNFHNKPLIQRTAVVAAGPIANFLLAIVIFAGIFAFIGKPISTPRVDTIQPDSAAAAAGFRAGDIVKSIDDTPIETFAELQRRVSTNPDVEMVFVVDRGGEPVTLTATPKLKEVKDSHGNTFRIGLLGISRNTNQGEQLVEPVPIPTALWLGVKETWFVIDRTFSFFGGLATGTENADQLGGPLRIAQVSGQLASVSFAALIQLVAVLSVSIGFLNLLPIPILDGGHLVYYGIEAIRGKPLSEKAMQMGFRVGLAAVLMLMIFATWNDLNWFGS